MKFNKVISIFVLIVTMALVVVTSGCGDWGNKETSDSVQQKQQETINAQATSAVGMPAITNFRERKLVKDLFEMRDQEGLTMYYYVLSEQTGKFHYIGMGIGYPIPYATQFTNPMKVEESAGYVGAEALQVIPQADPNGLYTPSSAEGTWVMLKDPNSDKVLPVYLEPKVVASPFKLKYNVEK